MIDIDDISLVSHIKIQDAEYEIDLIDGSLDKTMKQFEARLLARLYPEYPSSRLLAEKVGMSHSAVANKLREYGIKQK